MVARAAGDPPVRLAPPVTRDPSAILLGMLAHGPRSSAELLAVVEHAVQLDDATLDRLETFADRFTGGASPHHDSRELLAGLAAGGLPAIERCMERLRSAGLVVGPMGGKMWAQRRATPA
jgi:hypothetical protein